MKKRILFLGGAYAQMPIIQEAKARGHYIITCDYLPDNPGHKIADEYYNVSTTDSKGVLKLAEKVSPDFIIAYASDVSAPVAAFVSEKLGLPGNPYKSVCTLAEKDLFRDFLRKHGFNTPRTATIEKSDDIIKKARHLCLPLIIKPTDSSGSKGVSKVDSLAQIYNATDYAFSFSRNNRVIAEEIVDNEIADIHGDGFVINGELVFALLGDHIYNKDSNPYNPTGTLWPSKELIPVIEGIKKKTANIIKKSGYQNGPVNIEARIDSNGRQFIMEIGPRSGGHFVPQAIKYASGFDMVKAYLDLMEGKRIVVPNITQNCSAYYAIHSDIGGILKKIEIEDDLKEYVREFHQYKFPGDRVEAFKGANCAIGILLMTFKNRHEMENCIKDINKMIVLVIA